MNSDSKHTPGPWRTFAGNPAKIEILCEDRMAPVQKPSAGIRVAEVRAKRIGKGGAFKPNAADEANARLIAAAPEMLAVLRRIRDSYPGYIPDFIEDVNAAIAKAEGSPALSSGR